MKILKIIAIGIGSFLLLFYWPMYALLMSIREFWSDGLWFQSFVNGLWLTGITSLFFALLVDLYNDKI